MRTHSRARRPASSCEESRELAARFVVEEQDEVPVLRHLVGRDAPLGEGLRGFDEPAVAVEGDAGELDRLAVLADLEVVLVEADDDVAPGDP